MVFKFSINYFIFFAAMATIVPYLQQILKMHGFSASEIGFLLGVFEITGVFGPLIIGWFADRIGKYRSILLVLTMGAGLSFFLFVFDIGFIGTVMVLIFFGLMYRPIASLTDALASRTLSDVVQQYGKARIWGSIGFVVISFFYQIWGFLDSASSYRIVIVFTVLMVMLFISNLSLPQIQKISTSEDKKNLVNKDGKTKILATLVSMPSVFWVGIAAAFFIKMGMSGYYSFFSIYLHDVYNLKGISGIWGLGALSEIPVVLWGSRYVVKYGVAKMILLAAVGTIIRMLIYAVVPPLPLVLFGQVLHALSFGLLHVTIIVLINNQIEDKSRAMAMAIFGGISYGLAGFIGSSLSGLILDGYGFSVMYIFCAVVIMGAVFLIAFFRKVGVII
ncbi:MAG: MFS transporter [Spirochaetaceae bacterium]|nr:MFS transporter [Spirochaetaceae bacterium]